MSAGAVAAVAVLSSPVLCAAVYVIHASRSERRSRRLARDLRRTRRGDVSIDDVRQAAGLDPGPLPPETDLAAAMAQAEALHAQEWGRLW